MPSQFPRLGISTLTCLIAFTCLHSTVSANTVFTNTELAILHEQCTKNPETVYTTNSKKSVLLYHRDGFIPAIHFELPDKTRADSVDSAAVILCLDDAPEEIEICEFNIFFSVARLRERFLVEAVPLDSEGKRVDGLYINGSEPVDCSEIDNVDNTVTSVAGDAVSTDDVLGFLSENNLDRQDNDRDGLRNIEEFKIGSDPEDSNSPAARSVLTVNGATNAELFSGETADIRVDLFPAQFLGNAAEYFFWADMPEGRFVFQYPAGLVESNTIQSVLSAPLVRLFDFRLLRLKNLDPGEYQFHFEARDSNSSVEESIATLTVLDDPCREDVVLPLNTNENWKNNCLSQDDSKATAAYFSFTLTQQSDLALELTADTDARLVLRSGIGRSGAVLDKSEDSVLFSSLNTNLDAGSYTLEIINNESIANASYTLASNMEILPWRFTDITAFAGINHTHGYLESDIDETDPSYERILQGAGVAAGDYDQDGWTDLYVTSGSSGSNLLYRNQGDGTFVDVAENAGINFNGRKDTGATFADVDGDGWPDLFLGGVNGTPPLLLHNNQNGTFSDITEDSGLAGIINSYSASFADYDRDGDLDAYISHWNTSDQASYLFQNDGTGIFTDISTQAGIPNGLMADYTPIFSDINNDGWLDLLVAADFNTSQVYLNNQNGTFSNITDDNVITDDNGMGAAVGDYDNDGDMDWFVSSIFDPNGISQGDVPGASTGATGNRLYRNKGDGTFEDVVENAGVRIGSWGWGSCFTDFNNDTHLDIFHVNGYTTGAFNNNAQFLTDGSRLFLSNGDGTFRNGEIETEFSDNGQGRGITCFDFDLDGDIDIFIANNQQAPTLFRNDGGNDMNYLHISLGGSDANLDAIGARISLTINDQTQTREIYAGNNYISNNPPIAYFGLGDADSIDEIRIQWPDGDIQTFSNVSANQILTIYK